MVQNSCINIEHLKKHIFKLFFIHLLQFENFKSIILKKDGGWSWSTNSFETLISPVYIDRFIKMSTRAWQKKMMWMNRGWFWALGFMLGENISKFTEIAFLLTARIDSFLLFVMKFFSNWSYLNIDF